MAGNYGAVRGEVWPRATAVVWLNVSLPVALWRVVRRTATRLARREVLWHGNRESLLRALFTRESIVWWVLTTHHLPRKQLSACAAQVNIRTCAGMSSISVSSRALPCRRTPTVER
jgi:hypothetical protein